MATHHHPRALRAAALLGAACLLLAGCRIEHKSAAATASAALPTTSSNKGTFDAQAEVAGLWESKALPAIDKMAVDWRELKKAMAAGLDGAGARHGFREKGEGAPWNLALRFSGKVIATDVEVRAGTADVDTDGDGKADLQLQVGPVVKGATLRDILPFISFTAYTNQIDFAQLASALNDKAAEGALKSLDRATLNGKTVEGLGVFTAESADEMPVVTLVTLKVGK